MRSAIQRGPKRTYTSRRCDPLIAPFGIVPGKRGGFDRSMQHHLMDVLFKDGVYDPRKMGETFA